MRCEAIGTYFARVPMGGKLFRGSPDGSQIDRCAMARGKFNRRMNQPAGNARAIEQLSSYDIPEASRRPFKVSNGSTLEISRRPFAISSA